MAVQNFVIELIEELLGDKELALTEQDIRFYDKGTTAEADATLDDHIRWRNARYLNEDSNIIRSSILIIQLPFENGTEYTIVSVALNLPKEAVRLLQQFDFTKRNPKLIYLITTETLMSPEDSIYVTFLSLLGFDVLFYVPTGYNIENHFNKKRMEEHQLGDYMYDLQVPDWNRIPSAARKSWRDKIFKRG